MGRRVTQSMACVIQYSSAGSAPSTSQTVYIRYQLFPVGIVTVTGSGRRRVGGPVPQTSWVVDVQQCPGRARTQWRDARCARPGGDVHDRNAMVGGPDRRKIISVRSVIIRADMTDRVPLAAVRGTCRTGAVARFDNTDSQLKSGCSAGSDEGPLKNLNLLHSMVKVIQQ
jgi:hypothetical protein